MTRKLITSSYAETNNLCTDLRTVFNRSFLCRLIYPDIIEEMLLIKHNLFSQHYFKYSRNNM